MFSCRNSRTLLQNDMSLCVRKPTIWVSDQVDTNSAVLSQKIARSLKFRIYEKEKLYCLCSENKGTDQLHGYCEADVRLCFCLCRLLVFPCGSLRELVKELAVFPRKIQMNSHLDVKKHLQSMQIVNHVHPGHSALLDLSLH